MTRRIVLFFTFVTLTAAVLSFTLYSESRVSASEPQLRVGAGDDVTGLLMADIVAAGTDAAIELTTFMDCCGSAAQWALAGGELDVGFYCGGIALSLVSQNSALEIYAPAVMNAELVALGRDADEIDAVAIPQKRTFLSELVSANFPSVREILPVSPAALHYTLAGGEADGAVVGVTEAFDVPGFNYVPLAETDYISYCLVVNKSVVGTEPFERFLRAYNQMADNYNDTAYLAARHEMSESFWELYNTRFLKLV